MCRYRKLIFTCNHTQLLTEPFIACSEQQEYIAGTRAEPCNVANSHMCSTIRINHMCQQCEDKKIAQDGRLSELKRKMAFIRQHLDEKHDNAMKQVDEARLAAAATSEEVEKKKKIDPVEAFLRAKKNEKHSHLMMLGTF
ncbi:hypothetical protein F4859DRAFT_513677 [Xylaria cf. heliscus]|nr:hypothetical protein F4859DRAFT_513677 [Xylaria cf. heliscus]